jgi:hypothetical protein
LDNRDEVGPRYIDAMTSAEEKALGDERLSPLEELEVLEEKLRLHPGAIHVQRREELVRGVSVWSRNTKALMRHLRLAETNENLQEELAQNVYAPTVRDEYFAKLDQQLHNTLASAISLVEQTRPFMADYKGTVLHDGFRSLTKQLMDKPANEFLRRFRNYLVHYGMAPFVVTSSTKDGKKMITSLIIDAERLLEWSGWTAGPYAFLQSQTKGINLADIVHKYAVEMNDLYEWLITQLDNHHKADIARANELIIERNLLLTGDAHRDRESFNRLLLAGSDLAASTAFKGRDEETSDRKVPG